MKEPMDNNKSLTEINEQQKHWFSELISELQKEIDDTVNFYKAVIKEKDRRIEQLEEYLERSQNESKQKR